VWYTEGISEGLTSPGDTELRAIIMNNDMTTLELAKECGEILKSLTEHGKLVCKQFESELEKTYFCKNCGYSQYVHLCKKVIQVLSNMYIPGK
jgi:hypothetical protein